jgi:ZIP family zinc transporter
MRCGSAVDPVGQGLVASLIAGLATGLGGLPVLFGRRVSHRMLDAVLGFAAGVMFAVSAGALLVDVDPAAHGVIAAALIGGLVVLGLRGVAALDRARGGSRLTRGARVALIITLHNVVEGMAVLATFSELGRSVGIGVAVAISAHNVPEGLAVAEPLRRAGLGRWRCLGLTLASGLGEPLGALLAVVVVGPLASPGIASALAAGAMVVLASTELIPEAFSHAYVAEAAIGLLLGVLFALALIAAPW